MLPTTFPQFPKLELELRRSIWGMLLHFIFRIWQVVVSRLGLEILGTKTRRNLSTILQRQPSSRKINSPLRVHILNPYDGLKMCFEEGDFETFVDLCPISAVCHEARLFVAEFCQPLVSHVRCEYRSYSIWSLKPPENGA